MPSITLMLKPDVLDQVRDPGSRCEPHYQVISVANNLLGPDCVVLWACSLMHTVCEQVFIFLPLQLANAIRMPLTVIMMLRWSAGEQVWTYTAGTTAEVYALTAR